MECGESDVHTFDELNHVLTFSEKILKTPLMAVRWRGDQTWGFKCRCGNTNLLAKQEKQDMDKLVAGDPISVKKIADSLLIPDDKLFEMRSA